MTPQPVLIYGVACVLAKNNGGGALTNYLVTEAKSGAVLAQQPHRLLAVARAAQAIRTQRTPQ